MTVTWDKQNSIKCVGTGFRVQTLLCEIKREVLKNKIKIEII